MTGHGGNGARPEFSGRWPGGGQEASNKPNRPKSFLDYLADFFSDGARWKRGAAGIFRAAASGGREAGNFRTVAGKVRKHPAKLSGKVRKNPAKIRKNPAKWKAAENSG